MITTALLLLLAAPPRLPLPSITIDDGPNYRHHIRTLQLLQQHHVKAIWFVNGHFLWNPRNRVLLKRIIAAGHQIGNHTFTHRDPCRLTARQFRAELERNERIINRTLGWSRRHRLRYYRPPFGHRCHVGVAIRLGYRVVYWNRGDIGSSTRQMIGTVLHRYRYRPPRSSILLFHYSNYKLSAVLRRFYPVVQKRSRRPRPRL